MKITLSVNNITNYIKRGKFETGNARSSSNYLGAGIENAIGMLMLNTLICSYYFYTLPNRKIYTTSITSLESFNSATINSCWHVF